MRGKDRKKGGKPKEKKKRFESHHQMQLKAF